MMQIFFMNTIAKPHVKRLTYRSKIKPLFLFGVELKILKSEIYRYGPLQKKTQSVLGNNEYVIASSLHPQFLIIYDDDRRRK